MFLRICVDGGCFACLFLAVQTQNDHTETILITSLFDQ